MTILKRLGYYLGGFAIGLIILAFFFSGKKTSCAYFPEARVLKNINIKPQTLSAKAKSDLQRYQLDTLAIQQILKEGDVNFGESQTRKEPCGMYVIEGETATGMEVKVTLENCEEQVTITDIARQ